MANYSIPNIPVLATQLNDTDLFEKADGPASGQSQRVTGSVMKAYFGSAVQNQSLVLDNSSYVYQINHGLSRIPFLVQVVLQCISNDANLAVVAGQELDIATLACQLISPAFPMVVRDDTAIFVNLGRPLVGQEANWKMSQFNEGGTSNPSSFNNFKMKFYYA